MKNALEIKLLGYVDISNTKQKARRAKMDKIAPMKYESIFDRWIKATAKLVSKSSFKGKEGEEIFCLTFVLDGEEGLFTSYVREDSDYSKKSVGDEFVIEARPSKGKKIWTKGLILR